MEVNCGNPENYIICPDSNCGKKMYKCGVEDLRYKYTTESCKKEDTFNNGTYDNKWEVSGEKQSFKRCVDGYPINACSSGNTVNVELYTDCDCPSKLWIKNDQECIELSGKWENHEFYYPNKTVELFCHKFQDEGTERECGGSRGTLVKVEDRYGKCIKRNKQTVYEGCRCKPMSPLCDGDDNGNNHAISCKEKVNGVLSGTIGRVCWE